MSGRLILLCGIAGAGRTTLAKQLEAGGAVRMCPDEWLVALGFGGICPSSSCCAA